MVIGRNQNLYRPKILFSSDLTIIHRFDSQDVVKRLFNDYSCENCIVEDLITSQRVVSVDSEGIISRYLEQCSLPGT